MLTEKQKLQNQRRHQNRMDAHALWRDEQTLVLHYKDVNEYIDAGLVWCEGSNRYLSFDRASKVLRSKVRWALDSGYIYSGIQTRLFSTLFSITACAYEAGFLSVPYGVHAQHWLQLWPEHVPRRILQKIHTAAGVYAQLIPEEEYRAMSSITRTIVREEVMEWVDKYNQLGEGQIARHYMPVPKEMFNAPTKINPDFHFGSFGEVGEIMCALFDGHRFPVRVQVV